MPRSLLLAIVVMTGCTSLPQGPAVMALPGSTKTLADFHTDDKYCRDYASSNLNETNFKPAANDDHITVLGASGDYKDAAQQHYDTVYVQCMYAKGHRVPVTSRFSMDINQERLNVPPNIPLPPPGLPPPPPQ